MLTNYILIKPLFFLNETSTSYLRYLAKFVNEYFIDVYIAESTVDSITDGS